MYRILAIPFIFLFLSTQAQVKHTVNAYLDLNGNYCLDYSIDGKQLAIGGENKQIVIYDISTRRVIENLGKTKGTPLTLQYSPDGKNIAVGGKDKTITAWDTFTKQKLFSSKGHSDDVLCLRYHPKGKEIVSASKDGGIAIWDSKTGAIVNKLKGHNGAVTCLGISPDGKFIISGSEDEQLILWDFETGAPLKRFRGHKSWVRTVAFSPDGSMIASGGDDHRIHLWDTRTGRRINTLRMHKRWVYSLAFSPDGKYLLSGGHDKYIILTHIASGRIEFKSPKQDNYIVDLAFNPNGSSFSSILLNNQFLSIWELPNNDLKEKVSQRKQQMMQNSGFKPTINWTYPQQQEIVHQASIKIKANIFSESSLRTIKVFVNGKISEELSRSDLMLETAEKENTAFENLCILQEGHNEIWIEVSNIAGSTTSKKLLITYQKTAQEKFEWISPSTNQHQSLKERMQISARIPSASSKQKVMLLQNNKAGSTMLFPREGGMFSLFVTLRPGKNYLKFKIDREEGAFLSNEIMVEYIPQDKPNIIWKLPAQDTTTYLASNTIKANVYSATNIDRLEIFVNNLSVYYKNQTNKKAFELDQNLQLSKGVNTVRIEVSNSAGKSASAERKIDYKHTDETVISWVYPEMNLQNIYNSEISVKACIASNTTIERVELYLADSAVETIDYPQINKGSDCGFKLEKTIKLPAGHAAFQVLAYSGSKIIQSEVRSVNIVNPEAPAVVWKENSTAMATQAEELTVGANIYTNVELLKTQLYVNGELAQNLTATKVPDKENEFTVNTMVKLSPGKNSIEIRTQTQFHNTISAPIEVYRKTGDPYRFALIIGNQDYSNYQVELQKESDVEFALNDAKAFRETAIKRLDVPVENIIYYENARYIEMRKAIKKLNGILEVTEGKAEIFVFYAGHGFPDELTKEPYLIPVDGSATDLEFSAIKLSLLYEQLTEFQAKRITVFLDACFSGAARNQGLVAARGVRIVPRQAEEAVKKNLVVFSASSGDEAALAYKEKQQGMFTYHLLEKLNTNPDGLSYNALSEYLKQEVAVRSVLVNGVRQIPQTNISEAVQNEWQNWEF
jgi:WD40 repeat protein/predicted solute-binding protein